MLYIYQSGFRTNHSTDRCLSRLTGMISNGSDNEKHNGMILIDLQKAFETLDCKTLLEKMKCIGLLSKTIRCFHSYLTNKNFFVSLDNELLEALTINCGVPQGSILRLLLFLLYINDIPQARSDSHTHLYADDTSIFYQHKGVAEIENVLIKEFANVYEWLVDNKLSIHFDEDKTKCILFSKEKDLPELDITYKNNGIKRFNTVEYLGCYLDVNLSEESMAVKSLKKIS